MEERSIRENISEKVADLEEQVASHRGNYEKAASERDSQSNTVDGLQRALQEIQDGELFATKSSNSLTDPNKLAEESYEKLWKILKARLRACSDECGKLKNKQTLPLRHWSPQR